MLLDTIFVCNVTGLSEIIFNPQLFKCFFQCKMYFLVTNKNTIHTVSDKVYCNHIETGEKSSVLSVPNANTNKYYIY